MEGILHLLWMISWQAAILAVLVFAVTRLGGKAPAAWRYALWIIVAAKFVIPPFVDLPERYVPRTDQPVPQAVRVLMSPMLSSPSHAETKPEPQVWVQGDVRPMEPPRSISLPDPISVLGGMWLLGMLIMIARLTRRYSLQAKIRRGSVPAESELAALLKECAIRLNISHIPGMLLSGNTCTPMLIGLFKPTIILPIGVTDVCSQSDLTAILMHELAHVKRRDMAALWLHQIVQTVFFFHPAAWLVGRELNSERELACDEMVLSTPGIERIEYAAGYLSAVKFASRRSIPSAGLSMSESFEVQKRRLGMILNRSIPRMSPGWVAILLLIVAVGIPTFGIGDPTPSMNPPSHIAGNQEPTYNPGDIIQQADGDQTNAVDGSTPSDTSTPQVLDEQGNPVFPTPSDAPSAYPEADDGPVYHYVPKQGDVKSWDRREELLRDAAFDTERLDKMIEEITDPAWPIEPANSICLAAGSIIQEDPKRAAALYKAGLRYRPANDALIGGLCRSYVAMGQPGLALTTAKEEARRLKAAHKPISNAVRNVLQMNWESPVPSAAFKWLWRNQDSMTPDDYVYIARRWAEYKQLDQALEWLNAGIARANRRGWDSSDMQRFAPDGFYRQQAQSTIFAPETYELRLKWLSMLRKQSSAKLVYLEAKKRHPNYPFIENVPEIQDVYTADWKATDKHKTKIKALPVNATGSSGPLTAVIMFGVMTLEPSVTSTEIATLERNIKKDWERQWLDGYRITHNTVKEGIPGMMQLVRWAKTTLPAGTYLRNTSGRSSIEEVLAGFNTLGKKNLGAAFYLASFLTAPAGTDESTLKAVRDNGYLEECWNTLGPSEREELATVLRREKVNQKALSMLREMTYVSGVKQVFTGI
ncbi:MAG: M56 family metallopeptidase [Armatimonadota bacterium]